MIIINLKNEYTVESSEAQMDNPIHDSFCDMKINSF